MSMRLVPEVTLDRHCIRELIKALPLELSKLRASLLLQSEGPRCLSFGARIPDRWGSQSLRGPSLGSLEQLNEGTILYLIPVLAVLLPLLLQIIPFILLVLLVVCVELLHGRPVLPIPANHSNSSSLLPLVLLVSHEELLIRDPLVNSKFLLLLWKTFNLFLHVPKILFKCRIQFNGEIR